MKKFKLTYRLKGYYCVDEPELKIEGPVTATYYVEAQHWYELMQCSDFVFTVMLSSPPTGLSTANLSGDPRPNFPSLEWQLYQVEYRGEVE